MDSISKFNSFNYLNPSFKKEYYYEKKVDKKKFMKDFGFEKSKKGKIDVEHNTFSKQFLRYVNIVFIKDSDSLGIYNYKKHVYEFDAQKILKRIIKRLFDFTKEKPWNPQRGNLVIQTILHDCSTFIDSFDSGDYINLQDGVLDLKSFELKKHSPDYYCTIQIPIRFNDNIETPTFNQFLDDITCGDEELKIVLQEIIGYCLCNETRAEKAFFFIGNGANGKSVLAKVIQALVGTRNCSSTTLSELSKNFGLSQLIGSKVNIAAENNASAFSSDVFKAVVSGDRVEVNRKYREAITVTLCTKLIMLFNELPQTTDSTYGFFRKLMIVPFNRTFSDDEKDVRIFEKMEPELSGIFHWALDGLKRLKENDYVFSKCELCERALNNYQESINPVASFFIHNYKPDEGQTIRKSEIYDLYEKFCIGNSYSPVDRQKFWRGWRAYCSLHNISFKIKRIKGYEYIEGISPIKDYLED